MAIIEINLNPTEKELRSFGRAGAIASLLITILLYVIKGLAVKWCFVIVAAGVLCFLCSIISTRLTRWIYIGLTLLTVPIGTTISFLVLVIFYYFLLTPISLIFRLMGRDALHRKFDQNANSYWLPHRDADNIKRYFNQF